MRVPDILVGGRRVLGTVVDTVRGEGRTSPPLAPPSRLLVLRPQLVLGLSLSPGSISQEVRKLLLLSVWLSISAVMIGKLRGRQWRRQRRAR